MYGYTATSPPQEQDWHFGPAAGKRHHLFPVISGTGLGIRTSSPEETTSTKKMFRNLDATTLSKLPFQGHENPATCRVVDALPRVRDLHATLSCTSDPISVLLEGFKCLRTGTVRRRDLVQYDLGWSDGTENCQSAQLPVTR